MYGNTFAGASQCLPLAVGLAGDGCRARHVREAETLVASVAGNSRARKKEEMRQGIGVMEWFGG